MSEAVQTARPAAAKASVLKGSGFLIAGRMIGMLGGFVLFLLLTWRSKEMAGVFRTAITFFTIMDFLPLLGMHRWLATEIARHAVRGDAIFRIASLFAVAIALVSAGVYLAIVHAGFYGPDISDCLAIVALATVPSAVNLCVTSALVGLGYSHQSGIFTIGESLVRSVVAIALVLSGAGVIWLIVVFAVIRWIIAGLGLAVVRGHVAGTRSRIDAALRHSFAAEIPNLALSMVGFLAIRNSAMLLLPWLRGEAEAGIYAAPFQLFDLLLLVPTVLTYSTNHAFVESAHRSVSALRRSTNALIYVTTLYVFPLAAIAFVLARPMIELLFGVAFDAAIMPFRLLLATAAVVSLDQVFALGMVTAGKYRSDRVSIVVGAMMVSVATWALCGPLGATGAALSLLIGCCGTLALRLALMGGVVRFRALLGALRRQAMAAVAAALIVWVPLAAIGPLGHGMRLVELLLAPVGCGVYLALLYLGGGLSSTRMLRIRTFMARRG